MDDLKDTLHARSREAPLTSPQLFNLSKKEDSKALEELFEEQQVRRVSDDYDEQLHELFAVQNPATVYTPQFETNFSVFKKTLGDLTVHGIWAYFPWSGVLTHILPDREFQLVRTARNQNLITSSEQRQFYNATIGIAGLSVGSSVAFAITLQGGGRKLKLADMDCLALTNTNRILTGVHELGQLKVDMAKRRICEMNPYADIELFAEGLTKTTIEKFFDGLDLVIDEIDNLAVKCLIREEARKRRIPVLMAADNGDNAVVDIERYDLDPMTPFFHNRMGEVSYDMLKSLDKFETGRLITKLVGPENVTQRMQESLLEMGKTIVSWPQLGGAALVNGAAVAYCARKILTADPLESNRALISLDEKLIPGYTSEEERGKRYNVSKEFARKFGIDI